MKAITIRQPYAQCIAIGAKLVENRSRPTYYRGLVAIHAGKTPHKTGDHDERVLHHLGENPRHGAATGAVIAVADLTDCHRASPTCCQPWGDAEHNGNPAWHIVFAPDVHALDTPVLAIGRLTVPWILPADVAAQVERQFAGVAP